MEDESEDKVKILDGEQSQEGFHYFSITSAPEASKAVSRPASEHLGVQAESKVDTHQGEAGMLETDASVQSKTVAEDVVQSMSPVQPLSNDDLDQSAESRICRNPKDLLLRPSELVTDADTVSNAEMQQQQLSMYLEEKQRQDTTLQDGDFDCAHPMPDESNPAAQEPTMDLNDAETFFDQICLFQSRRMNDQRCSFRHKRRGDDRPWQSAPATPTGMQRSVFFPSTMSLQTEEFFDLVATAQAQRLDDQRADFLEDKPPVLILCAPPPSRKVVAEQRKASEVSDKSEKGEDDKEGKRRRKQNRRFSTGALGPPRPAPDEALYNMILTHQSERIEDQRSDPPIPVDAEDLFELLFRAQGARMEEQRTELPSSLQERKFSLF